MTLHFPVKAGCRNWKSDAESGNSKSDNTLDIVFSAQRGLAWRNPFSGTGVSGFGCQVSVPAIPTFWL